MKTKLLLLSCLFVISVCYSQNEFITKWRTTSSNEDVIIGTVGDGYNYNIYWGDGTVNNNKTGLAVHTFKTPGDYYVRITGDFPRIVVNYNSQLLEIFQWGNIEWKSMQDAFKNCYNVKITATDSPNLSNVTDFSSMFEGCTNLTANTSINNWDVSNAIYMQRMFLGAKSFNHPIGNWNTQNVKNMQQMFYDAKAFNQPIGNWNTIKVENMQQMFNFATLFNQEINSWNVSNVSNMSYMFSESENFNGNISSWDVSKVTDMSYMFKGAKKFNQNISSWDVSMVTNMQHMFRNTDEFNQDLNSWDVGSVTDMKWMFDRAKKFNGNISNWNVSNVTDMNSMFYGATSFNQDIGGWNVGKVTNMSEMFRSTVSFNQNLSNWNVSNVKNMIYMFSASVFNQNIDKWDVSKVEDMRYMFQYNYNFNQDLNSWNVSKVTDMRYMFRSATSFNGKIDKWDLSNVKRIDYMFKGASAFNQNITNWDIQNVINLYETFQNASSFNQNIGLWNISSVTNMHNILQNSGVSVLTYDKILDSWSKSSNINSNISLGATGIFYCNGEAARSKLINDKKWNIFGDSKNCSTIDTPTTTNGMWNDPTNWASGVVPISTDNVVIPTGTTLQVSADISEINSLENEGTIVISPTYSLKSKSNMVNTGTIIMDSSTDDSSVLFIEGTSSGNVTYTRGGLKANKWSLVTPPVSGQKIKEFATDSNNDIRINTTVNPNRYAIGYYSDAATEGDKWVYYTANIDENSTFTAGQSYALSRATDGSVSFTGTLTTNNLTKTLQPGEWNAIGNPFTTYYPANKNGASSFINDNYDILDDNYKGIYVWDNAQNKYVAVSEADFENRALTPGQGFFIKLKAGENEIEFKEDKRSLKPNTGNNVFNKNDNSYIQLFASNGEYKVATNIIFLDNATSGFDVGLDIGNFSTSSFDFYTKLVDMSNDKNYTTQSLAKENMDNIIIPLELAVKNSKVTFSSKPVNLGENVKLYLEDRVRNTFTDITKETDSYKISFDETDIIKDRFYLHVKSEVLDLDNSLINQIQVFSSNKTLHILGIKDQIKVEVFNLLGKNVYTKFFNNINTIDIPLSVSDGVYVVKVIVDNKSITKKTVLR